jgi:hypothetical protein
MNGGNVEERSLIDRNSAVRPAESESQCHPAGGFHPAGLAAFREE